MSGIDLSKKQCGTSGCEGEHDKIFIHARCHISSRLDCELNNRTGELRILCGECKKEVVQFQLKDPNE